MSNSRLLYEGYKAKYPQYFEIITKDNIDFYYDFLTQKQWKKMDLLLRYVAI